MKSLVTLGVAFVFSCGAAFLEAGPPPQADSTVTEEQENRDSVPDHDEELKDITEQVRKFNDRSKFAGPPIEFRQGHVSSRELTDDALSEADGRFEIQLPGNAPVPTITFYNGRIYCSGGFHSKEYFCFDANNGRLVWAINLDDDGPSAAVCEDNICVFNTESCTIFAVDASNGEHIWSWWLGDPLMSTPTISNGRVFTSYPASGRFEGGGILQMGQIPNAQNPANAPENTELPHAVPQNALPQQLQQQIAPQNDAPQPNPIPDVPGNDDAPRQRADGLVAPPAQSHVLACFDLRTGAILWQRWIDSDVMSAPIADGDEIFATTFSGTVYRLRQSDGEILSVVRSRATSAPVIVGEKVNFSRRADDDGDATSEVFGWYSRQEAESVAEFGKRAAPYLDSTVQQKSDMKVQSADLDAGNGFGGGAPASANTESALDNIGQNNVSSLQAFQGSRGLYYNGWTFNCPGDRIVCNDENGEELWNVQLEGDLAKVGGMLAAPPIHAGGKILVSTLKGDILQIDPESGEVETTYNIGHPLRFPPIAQDGKIYVGTQNGKVICVDTGNAALTGWTTWGGNSAHNKTN